MSNFDHEKYKEIEELENSLKIRTKSDLSVPLYILRGGDKQYKKSAEAIEVTTIERLQQPKELLDIYGEFRVIGGGDNIFLRHLNLAHEYILHHPENVESIRQALSLKKPFIIKIVKSNYEDEIGKVLEYTNGDYIHWKGWKPSFVPDCVGMPIGLFKIDKPEKIEIKMDLEKEELHHHGRNKWISRISMLAVLLLLTYQFKDKVYEFGNSLLK